MRGPARGMGAGFAMALRRAVARVLLPAAFRREHGAAMEAAFAAQLEEAGRRGSAARAALLLREVRDLGRAAVELRRRGGAGGGEGSRRAGPGAGGAPRPDVGRELVRAARTLGRRPTYAAGVVGTLALGVGSAAAVATLVGDVLVRPLPYPRADRLAHVYLSLPSLGWERGPVSLPVFDDWRRAATPFEGLGAYQPGVRTTLAVGGEARAVGSSRVSGGLFATLGVPPLHGRTLGPADEGAGREPVVVLSHALWSDAFGADPDAVGRTVDLGGSSATVVGVMPADFPALARGDELWTPLPVDVSEAERDANFLAVLGRLRPGVSAGDASRAMEALVRRLEAGAPGGVEGRSVRVVTRAEVVTGSARGPLLAFLAAAGLLLALTCANLAGLAAARADARTREMAVRAALGGAPRSLFRAALAESAVAGAAGAALALPVAWAVLEGLLRLAPAGLPRRAEIGVDGATAAAALLAGVAAALVSGALPALRAARAGADRGLAAAADRDGAGSTRLRAGLVVGQVALATVLLAGAGLLGTSLRRLGAAPTGFEPSGVLTFRVKPPAGAYEAAGELDALYDGLIEELEAIPGARAVGGAWALPLGGSYGSSEYHPEGRPDDATLLQLVPVRGDYFEALGIGVVRGRSFGAGDGADGRRVAMVGRSWAERTWPGSDPVGRRVVRGENAFEVVGIVEDVRLRRLGEEPPPQLYLPHRAAPWARDLALAVRTEGDPAALAPAVRAALRRVDGRIPPDDVATMEARVAGELAEPRFRAALVGAFSGLAALLALLGIYGVTATVVARSTRDIGVRMALGAGRGRVLAGVLGRAAALAGVGAALGLLAAVPAGRLVEGLLYRTGAVEPGVHAAVALALVGAALLAALGPARRAATVDPAGPLRTE